MGYISRRFFYFLLIFLGLSLVIIAYATNYSRFEDVIVKNTQSIGSNTTPNSKAVLDLVSTTKGLLPPRLTTTQKNAISSPTTGLVLYDSTTNFFNYYNGSSWLQVASLTGTETLTNKTIDGSLNTITNVSLTTGVTGILPVPNGGTGLGSLTSHAVVVGNGTSTPTLLVGTTGQIFSGFSGADPAFTATPTLGVDGVTSGTIRLANGGGGGAGILIRNQNTTSTYNLNLPATSGSSSDVLTSGGGGSTDMTWTGAVSTNTVSTIVKRDSSGNFSAGTITAALTGTASGNTTYTPNNHGVVLSSSTNAMTVLAPDASTSKVLISGGASADPTWGTVSVAGGGTGQTSYTDGQLLIGNSSGNTLTKTTLTAGANITITNGGGSITIAGTSSATPAYTYTSQTSTYTAVIGDYVKASGASFTITLPTAVGQDGKEVIVEHGGTNLTQVYTIATTSGQTIEGVASGTIILTTKRETFTFISDGSNWLIRSHYGITDWVDDGVVTITGTTTSPTKGNATVLDHNYWRRDGRDMLVRMVFQNGGTGSATGSGDYYFSIPQQANITIDTTYLDAYATVEGTGNFTAKNVVGNGFVSNIGTSSGLCGVQVYNTGNVRLFLLDTANGGSVNSGLYSMGANINYTAYYRIPITNWWP